jgi:hypothetical protein
MSKSTLFCCTAVAVGIVLGAGIDRVVGSDDSATAVSSSATSATVQPLKLVMATAPAASIDTNQMRAMMREELAAALAKQGSVHGAETVSRPVPEAAPVTRELQEQRSQAMQTANEIISNGQWGEEERAAFHRQLAKLDPVQFEQEMQQLAKGIDSGAISVNTPGLIL